MGKGRDIVEGERGYNNIGKGGGEWGMGKWGRGNGEKMARERLKEKEVERGGGEKWIWGKRGKEERRIENGECEGAKGERKRECERGKDGGGWM